MIKIFFDTILGKETEKIHFTFFEKSTKKVFQYIVERDNILNIDFQQYANQYDIYFSSCLLNTDEQGNLIRNKENFISRRNLFLDIDVGDNKNYINKEEARVAIFNVLFKKLNLPPTFIVDSGNGWHVHYCLEDSIKIDAFNRLTSVIIDACRNLNLSIDNCCTTDPVRLMRLPGTINHKGNHEVKLKYSENNIYTWENLLEVFSEYKSVDNNKSCDNSSNQSVNNDYDNSDTIEYDAEKIIAECSLFKDAMEYPHIISEPIWRGILSVLIKCKDGYDWCHKISKYDKARYNKKDTDDKIKYLQEKNIGPYRYETFQQLGAIFRTPIVFNEKSTPLMLGKTIKEDAYSKIVPAGYIKKNNKIYEIIQDKQGVETEILIMEGDIYPLPIEYRDDAKESSMIRFLLSFNKDKSRSVNIYTKDLYNNEKMKAYLGAAGLTTDSKSIGRIIEYMRKLLKLQQFSRKEMAMNSTFGWLAEDKEGYSTFLIGDHLYSKKEPEKIFIGNDLKNYDHIFKQKGSIDKPIEMLKYLNKNKLVDQMFCMLIPFASPLMEYTPINGMWFHLKGRTGTGKTTTQRMMNSIFGNPDLYMNSPKDTPLAIEKRWEMYKNLHFCVDETTLLSGSVLNDLLFRASQGAPKSRLTKEAKENFSKIRSKLLVVSSSNNSIMDQIVSQKKEAEAESKRIIEIEFLEKNTTTTEAEIELNNKCMENYGILGHWYLDKICKINSYQFKNLIDQNKRKILTEVGEINNERFWINGFAVILTAFDLLKTWNIIDWDEEIILNYILNLFKKLRNEATEFEIDAKTIISDIITENIDKAVVVEVSTEGDITDKYVEEDIIDLRIAKEKQIRLEHVIINGENYTNIFIANMWLKKYLTKNRISYMSFYNDLVEKGLLESEKIPYRLLANTKFYNVSRKKCLHVRYKNNKEEPCLVKKNNKYY